MLDVEEDKNECWYYFVLRDDSNAKDKIIDISYHEREVTRHLFVGVFFAP